MCEDKFINKDNVSNYGFKMGKLRVYKDGTTKLICGDNKMNVKNGVSAECH